MEPALQPEVRKETDVSRVPLGRSLVMPFSEGGKGGEAGVGFGLAEVRWESVLTMRSRERKKSRRSKVVDWLGWLLIGRDGGGGAVLLVVGGDTALIRLAGWCK